MSRLDALEISDPAQKFARGPGGKDARPLQRAGMPTATTPGLAHFVFRSSGLILTANNRVIDKSSGFDLITVIALR